MKQTMRKLGIVLALALMVSRSALPQSGAAGVFNTAFWSIGTVAGVGVVGEPLSLTPPSNYTLDWSYAGTAPAACTLQAEGSSDAVHWFSLTGSQDCTTATMLHVANKPVLYLRINVLTYTPGDNTTAVTVRYTRGTV